MPTVSAHVAATLARHIDHVFGVMGNGNAYFLDALERSTDVGYTAVRHEAGGVVAADAYHRAGGGLAAATATYGAGFTNTLTALAEAVQAHVPARARRRRRADVGPPPVGRRPDRPRLGGRRAHLHGGPSGCRGDDGHRDRARADLPRAHRARDPLRRRRARGRARARGARAPAARAGRAARPVRRAGDPGCRRRAGRRERPFLLAGRGAWIAGAGDALGALADATGALTASTALGRGVFPRPEFDLGVTGGFGAEAAMELVAQADVAVVFGASLNQFTMRFGALFAPGTRVFQIDLAPAATHPHVGGYIRGDAAVVARAIVDELAALGAAPSGWRETVDAASARAYEPGDGLAPDGRLDPRSAAARIAELLPEDRVVVSDGGHFIGWANMYWPVASPDRMMMVGTAFQSIGLGFPSVPGAARAQPEATIVLTTGDGGGLMALADLESAVRVAGGRGLAVVWNDAAYGAEVQPLRPEGPRRSADAHPPGRLRGRRAAASAPKASSCARSRTSTDSRSGPGCRHPIARSCCWTCASRAR